MEHNQISSLTTEKPPIYHSVTSRPINLLEGLATARELDAEDRK